MSIRPVPLVGIPTCVRKINERTFHTAAERYSNAIVDATGCIPVLIPSIGPKTDCAALLDRLDAILLTGSPSNVEPHHYGGPPSREGTLHDPDRDATTLPLIREAVRRDMPVLAICRGIQELNVALGGTLHQLVHEIPGRLNHRAPPPEGPDGRYGPAHSVLLTPGGFLATLFGTGEISVNSLHSQGVDRPAPGLRIEAVAPDGQIEAISLPGARFVVGVQWHPEHRVMDHPLSLALFSAFARACSTAVTGLPTEVRAA